MEYLCDGSRHVICLPYSIANLHLMAADLRIHRGWFHHNHYDMPKRREREIMARCRYVRSWEIVTIINAHFAESRST